MTDDKPGTFRIADGAPVAMEDAKAIWAPLATRALENVARVYNGVINYGELAKELQAVSGIETRQMTKYWIGDVLGQVSRQCRQNGEPLLSALCVHQDGTIGDGYAIALAEAYGSPTPDDLEMAAAEERLRCYRHFGASLPADGGSPALTPAVATKRRAASRRAWQDRERPSCPSCHITLPASGLCDYCY